MVCVTIWRMMIAEKRCAAIAVRFKRMVTAMPELWWWVEPLSATGLILFLFAGIIVLVTPESGNDVWFWIVVILVLPLIIAFAATIIWGVSWVFWFIWAPYF